MKILAIDSSGLVASVAVTEDDSLIAEYTTNYKKTHSQTLLPMLDEVKKMIELDLSCVDAIAVSAGPGSFTGLRIGSATAKGLGLALDKPIISVPTVDALAMNVYGTDHIVCPLMDARRSQVYTGIYRFLPEETSQETSSLEVNFKLDILEPQCRIPGKTGGSHAPSLYLCPCALQQAACLGGSRPCTDLRPFGQNGIRSRPCTGIPAPLPGRTGTQRGAENSRR